MSQDGKRAKNFKNVNINLLETRIEKQLRTKVVIREKHRDIWDFRSDTGVGIKPEFKLRTLFGT
uniref:Uncharacterized protein n=1 Tax=Romanomermis culicivorax TaxID=13658 RepID=A0A915JKJ6_ROMCU